VPHEFDALLLQRVSDSRVWSAALVSSWKGGSTMDFKERARKMLNDGASLSVNRRPEEAIRAYDLLLAEI
jgi:hypothetical protein